MNKFCLLYAVLLAIPAYAVTPEELAADCLKIKNYAANGDGFYKQRNYQKARESYEMQVAWSETCELDSAKLATAYNNVALTYIREGNYLKARAWLEIMPEDKKSVYNFNLIKDKLPLANTSATILPAGEYWSYAGRSLWNSIIIKKAASNYTVDFEGYYGGANVMYYGPNVGDFSTSLAIENGRARYVMAEQDSNLDCIYDFSIKKNFLTLTKVSGDSCGFGLNVSAEGGYSKVAELN